jgi:hypothetical protein
MDERMAASLAPARPPAGVYRHEALPPSAPPFHARAMNREFGHRHDTPQTFWMAIGFGVLQIAMVALRHPYGDLRDVAWLWLVQLGIEVTMTTLFAVATAELAQRHHGLLRLVLKIAVVGWVALCALRFLLIVLDLRADDAGDAGLSAWRARVSWWGCSSVPYCRRG